MTVCVNANVRLADPPRQVVVQRPIVRQAPRIVPAPLPVARVSEGRIISRSEPRIISEKLYQVIHCDQPNCRKEHYQWNDNCTYDNFGTTKKDLRFSGFPTGHKNPLII